MRTAIVACCLLICGCTATMSVNRDIPQTTQPGLDVELANIKSSVNGLATTLASTPRDIDAVEAVLARYGLKLQE